MTFAIYGLRLKGETEVRYIGQTGDTDQRLAGHFSAAYAMPWRTQFANWLIENQHRIEMVVLGTADSRDEARRAERAAVAICLAMDHRLFNLWLVPAHKRIPEREAA